MAYFYDFSSFLTAAVITMQSFIFIHL